MEKEGFGGSGIMKEMKDVEEKSTGRWIERGKIRRNRPTLFES